MRIAGLLGVDRVRTDGRRLRSSVGALPTGVRDVNDDAVRARPFHLEIDMNAIARGSIADLLRVTLDCTAE